MSAQIIRALRKRADELENDAAVLDAEIVSDGLESAAKNIIADQARWLATEFRALAAAAEEP